MHVAGEEKGQPASIPITGASGPGHLLNGEEPLPLGQPEQHGALLAL